MTTTDDVSTARFGRLQSKGILLGLSGLRVAAIGVAGAILVPSLLLFGGMGIAIAFLPVAILVASAFVPVGGRVAVEWLPIAGHWALRRALHQDVYGVRPTKPRPAGTLALPGDAAALRLHLDPFTGAAMVHDAHRQTLTVTAVVAHPAFVLLGPSEQNRRVTAWGRVLAAMAGTEQIAAVQILESTIPDAGSEVLAFWADEGVHDGSWSSRTYGELIELAAPASARHRTTVSLTLDLRKAARTIRQQGRGVAGAAAVLRHDMATFASALRAAELHVSHWLDADHLADLIRTAYDPNAPEAEHGSRQDRLSSAGPVGIVERWDHFVCDDNAHTAVLWISEWPRSEAYPNFLHPLILKADTHKSFSLVTHPLPNGQAMRAIRRQKVDYITDADQKARMGQVLDLSDTQELQDILDRERELVAGHADLQFAGFIAVTAPSKDELDAAVSEVQRAAIACGCETRRLVGQQTQAFVAAALPLGRGL